MKCFTDPLRKIFFKKIDKKFAQTKNKAYLCNAFPKCP